MTKFEKVMRNLQDSLDTARTIEGVEWCQVTKRELCAAIELINSVSYIARDSSRHIDRVLYLRDALENLEACADE